MGSGLPFPALVWIMWGSTRGEVVVVETAVAKVKQSPAPFVRLRRRIISGTVAVGISALVLGWLVTATHPSIGEGSFGNPGDLRPVSDGFTVTRLVFEGVPGRSASVLLSVRNKGHARATLLGIDREHAGGFLDSVRFAPDPFTAGSSVGDLSSASLRSIALDPGEEAGMLLTLHVDSCPSYAPGTFASYEEIPLRVRSLGILTTQPLHLSVPIVIAGTADDGGVSCG